MNTVQHQLNPRPVLEIDHLDVFYGGRSRGLHAVRDVSITLAAGEIVAIVGESGSGKSTLAHAIIRLLPAETSVSAHALRVDGREVGALDERAMRTLRGHTVGLVPQDPTVALDPVKSIGYQLRESLRLHRIGAPKDADAIAAELLEQVGLDRPSLRLRQYPHELSGGMRQRVMIAIALACKPRLVIADEPTSGLDVTVQKRVLDTMTERVGELGSALLFITHDLGVAADRAHRIVVMQGGQIVESGLTEDVIRRPRADYTRQLLAAVPRRPAWTSCAQPTQSGDASRAREDQPQGGIRMDLRPEGVGAPALLEVRSLSRRFGGGWLRRNNEVLAVNDVSLRIAAGTTLGIVGESGSGKTTLARMLAGLSSPSSGQILFDGAPIPSRGRVVGASYRRAVQFVYQNPFSSLNPKWRVSEIISDPLRVNHIDDTAGRERRMRTLADAVALPRALLSRRAAELSGGQLQRVAIARALALEPRLVILDEPVSALDVKVQATILALLQELQQRLGLAYLFISHDLGVVNQIAGHVAVMHGGRIVEDGPITQVFGSPQHRYTQELLEAIPGRRLLPTHS